MTDEVRITSATGGMKGSKPCQLFSIPPWAMEQLGNVYGMGATKYDQHNYRKGYPVSLSINAAFRHMLAWLDGQDVDEESGYSHLAHGAWHLLAAMQTAHDYPVYDDRYKGPSIDASLPADVAEEVVNRVAENSAAWREQQRISHDVM